RGPAALDQGDFPFQVAEDSRIALMAHEIRPGSQVVLRQRTCGDGHRLGKGSSGIELDGGQGQRLRELAVRHVKSKLEPHRDRYGGRGGVEAHFVGSIVRRQEPHSLVDHHAFGLVCDRSVLKLGQGKTRGPVEVVVETTIASDFRDFRGKWKGYVLLALEILV